MIPQQNVVAFPEFSNAGTKIAPDAAKYAAGFQQSDVLPAEWLNYFLNKASAGQTVNNAIVDSIQKELQNVVSKSGQTPTEGDNQQVFKAIRSYIATKTNTMICDTDVDESPAVTGYDYINEYYDGLSVEVLFKNGHYGANASANLTFEIGELGAKKVYTPKDGETVLVKSNSVDRGDGYGTKNWFMQPFTSLKMMYDSSLDDNAGGWVILENAVVLSDSSSTSGYTVYADGYCKQFYKFDSNNLGITTIYLLVPYPNTNYIAIKHIYENSDTALKFVNNWISKFPSYINVVNNAAYGSFTDGLLLVEGYI